MINRKCVNSKKSPASEYRSPLPTNATSRRIVSAPSPAGSSLRPPPGLALARTDNNNSLETVHSLLGRAQSTVASQNDADVEGEKKVSAATVQYSGIPQTYLTLLQQHYGCPFVGDEVFEDGDMGIKAHPEARHRTALVDSYEMPLFPNNPKYRLVPCMVFHHRHDLAQYTTDKTLFRWLDESNSTHFFIVPLGAYDLCPGQCPAYEGPCTFYDAVTDGNIFQTTNNAGGIYLYPEDLAPPTPNRLGEELLFNRRREKDVVTVLSSPIHTTVIGGVLVSKLRALKMLRKVAGIQFYGSTRKGPPIQLEPSTSTVAASSAQGIRPSLITPNRDVIDLSNDSDAQSDVSNDARLAARLAEEEEEKQKVAVAHLKDQEEKDHAFAQAIQAQLDKEQESAARALAPSAGRRFESPPKKPRAGSYDPLRKDVINRLTFPRYFPPSISNPNYNLVVQLREFIETAAYNTYKNKDQSYIAGRYDTYFEILRKAAKEENDKITEANYGKILGDAAKKGRIESLLLAYFDTKKRGEGKIPKTLAKQGQL